VGQHFTAGTPLQPYKLKLLFTYNLKAVKKPYRTQ